MIPDTAFAPALKSYRIKLLFTHKNYCGAAISVMERRCAAPISKWSVTYRIVFFYVAEVDK